MKVEESEELLCAGGAHSRGYAKDCLDTRSPGLRASDWEAAVFRENEGAWTGNCELAGKLMALGGGHVRVASAQE